MIMIINGKKSVFPDDAVNDIKITKKIEELKEEKKELQKQINKIDENIEMLNSSLSINQKIYCYEG